MSSYATRVITCKGDMAWEAGNALVLEEVDVSPPHAMEIQIKVFPTSLCHSDLYAWQSQVQQLTQRKIRDNVEPDKLLVVVLSCSILDFAEQSIDPKIRASCFDPHPIKDALAHIKSISAMMSYPREKTPFEHIKDVLVEFVVVEKK